MARPTRLTRDLVARFRTIAEYSATAEDAAAELGIGRSTLHRYVADGKEAKAGTLARQFRDIYMDSRIVQKNRLMSVLFQKACAGDVSAAKFILQAVHKMSTRVELTGAGGGPIQTTGMDLSKLSDEQLEQLHAIAETAADVDDPDDDSEAAP